MDKTRRIKTAFLLCLFLSEFAFSADLRTEIDRLKKIIAIQQAKIADLINRKPEVVFSEANSIFGVGDLTETAPHAGRVIDTGPGTFLIEINNNAYRSNQMSGNSKGLLYSIGVVDGGLAKTYPPSSEDHLNKFQGQALQYVEWSIRNHLDHRYYGNTEGLGWLQGIAPLSAIVFVKGGQKLAIKVKALWSKGSISFVNGSPDHKVTRISN